MYDNIKELIIRQLRRSYLHKLLLLYFIWFEFASSDKKGLKSVVSA